MDRFHNFFFFFDGGVEVEFLLLQAAAPHLRKGSSVILIASIAGYHPQASMAMYGVTKTALLGLTKVTFFLIL